MSACRLAAASLVAALLCVSGADLRAEEGLWPLTAIPAAQVQASHGFTPTAAWLARVRQTTINPSGGCSGTFVSPEGLVLTKFTCVLACMEMQAAVRRSQATFGEACRDKALRRALPLFDILYCAPLDRDEQRLASHAGFLARTRAEEVKCPNRALRQLLSVEDVTDRMKAALDRAGPAGLVEAQRAQTRALQRTCGASDATECAVVPSYDGARFELHKYKVFRDVRLVFAPEELVGKFGLDGPSWGFPQHRFTAAFLRVYENGKPARTPHLTLAERTPQENDPVVLAGYAPGTQRRASLAWLQLIRELTTWNLPFQTELRGIMHQFAAEHFDPIRAATIRRQLDAQVGNQRIIAETINPALLAETAERERVLRARVERDPRMRALYGAAWDALGRHMAVAMRTPNTSIVENATCGSLYGTARDLVRAPAERAKPDGQRLESFVEARLANTERALLRPVTFDERLDSEILAFCFRAFRQELGAGHPIIKKLLEGRTPDEAAADIVQHTRLADVEVRRALWQGGRAAIEGSRDPMVALWRRIDGDVRAARKVLLEEITEPVMRADRQIAQARFEVFGTTEYPEGNGTLRLSFGNVASYVSNGNTIAAFVRLAATFGLATGRPPYQLPARWLEAKADLDLAMPLTFAASTDVVLTPQSGGAADHSGAPLLDRELRVVGMVSDANEAAAGSAFTFKADVARAVVLNAAAIIHVLERVYRAEALVRELRAGNGSDR